jgi:hypothetical protein
LEPGGKVCGTFFKEESREAFLSETCEAQGEGVLLFFVERTPQANPKHRLHRRELPRSFSF